MSARLSGVFNCTAEGWRQYLHIQDKYGASTCNLWLWLHGNSVCFHFTGLIRFYPQMPGGDLDMSTDEVEQALADLVGEGLVFHDHENAVVYIPDLVESQPNINFNKSAQGKKENSNITNAVSQMKSLPSSPLLDRFALLHGMTNPHTKGVRDGWAREGVKTGGQTGGQALKGGSSVPFGGVS